MHLYKYSYKNSAERQMQFNHRGIPLFSGLMTKFHPTFNSGATVFVIITLFFLIAALLVVAIVGLQFRSFLHSPVSVPDDGVLFEIRPGSPFTQVSNDLANAGIIDRAD